MDKFSVLDYNAFRDIAFDWADSLDRKDWEKLGDILAPTIMCLQVDYIMIGVAAIPAMPSSEFISMMSAPNLLGHPLVRTQHLIGATKYEYVSDTETMATHQIRAAHQRYTTPEHKEVEATGHGHGNVKHWYRKMENDGQWKFAGVKPEMYWVEGTFDKIFV
ncbi:hypothetical protein TCE0_033r09114 [Talaromyces pinophilus]|uniref:Scytalone dehydratase-like domain-containing protein n=1 Tax=Talaromyces pinophilus TaxID=128442 RepID=A0A6V8HJK1_TALPI|nr:hypothetical protein TCE0_033r09114 [Talaromyces pinophilus]